MLVTIITDASYCPDTGAAGCGYWIASGRGRAGGGAVLPECKDNIIAEMRAVAHGLYAAGCKGLLERNDAVLLQTDCMPAINLFKVDAMHKHRQYNECLEYFQTLVVFYNLTVNFRHVRGHTHIRDARHEANRRCDTRAKAFMLQSRADICEQRHSI